MRNYLHCSAINLSRTEVVTYIKAFRINIYVSCKVAFDVDAIDLVGIGDSKWAAVAHVRYLDGRRVSDSKSSRAYSCWYCCGVRQRGWMSEMSISSDSRIGHTDIGLARARERCIDGLRLRGNLREITVTAKYIVGCRRDGMGLNVRYRRDLILQGRRHSDVAGIGRGQNADDYEQLKYIIYFD